MLCGFSQADFAYARELEADDLEFAVERWSQAIAISEKLSIDADERGDDADRDFWDDIPARCEDAWEAAAGIADSYYVPGVAA